MINIFRKTSHDFSFLKTDIHAHLLPGVDDGAKTTIDSLRLIRGLQELGFENLSATPHVMVDYYPNTREGLKVVYDQLLTAIRQEGLTANVHLSAEYMLDPGFDKCLDEKKLLTWGAGKYVLVEMSYIAPTPQLEQYIFALRVKDYQPILAHPERYLFYHGDFTKLEALKQSGCQFQLNLLSLTGYYGTSVRRMSEKLLKKKMYDWAGTDLHNSDQLEALKRMTAQSRLMTKLLRYEFMNQKMYL